MSIRCTCAAFIDSLKEALAFDERDVLYEETSTKGVLRPSKTFISALKQSRLFNYHRGNYVIY